MLDIIEAIITACGSSFMLLSVLLWFTAKTPYRRGYGATGLGLVSQRILGRKRQLTPSPHPAGTETGPFLLEPNSPPREGPRSGSDGGVGLSSGDTMTTPFKPCPNCGGTDTQPVASTLGGWWIACEACGVSGPTCGHEADAADAWNALPRPLSVAALKARALSVAALKARAEAAEAGRDRLAVNDTALAITHIDLLRLHCHDFEVWPIEGLDMGELLAQVTAVEEERDRLARILAVERGDESQAPEGWKRHDMLDNWWGHRDGRRVKRIEVGHYTDKVRKPDVWVCYWPPSDGRTGRAMRIGQQASPALEAMEAADAARKTVSPPETPDKPDAPS